MPFRLHLYLRILSTLLLALCVLNFVNVNWTVARMVGRCALIAVVTLSRGT